MNSVVVEDDETVIGEDGSVIAYGFNRFVKDICDGDNCFICGSKRSDKEFNDEHVIPKWLLRHAGLFNQFITLPNTVKLRYDKYVLPCCLECNSFYGENLEEKVRPLLTSSYSDFKSNVSDTDAETLFIWLAFVFFKTHLKDTLLRLHQDRRKGEELISSKYRFEWLHHIHALIRSIFTGAKLDKGCIGTFVVLYADTGDVDTPFDYRDMNGINTVLLRIGNIALLASLDDAKLSSRFLAGHIKEVLGKPMNPIQLREMLAHLSYVSSHLTHRPTFRNEFDIIAQTSTIKASIPDDIALADFAPEVYGNILYLCTFDFLSEMSFSEVDNIEVSVKSGKMGFIFDENGNFFKNGSIFSTKIT